MSVIIVSMSMEVPAPDAEKAPKYERWYYDPEQVENLVTLLEAKTIDDKTGKERWKFGSGLAYSVMFPSKDTVWEAEYDNAPIPETKNSFKVMISNLVAGRRKFGAAIPEDLSRRFKTIMLQREGKGVKQSHDREKYWSNDKRLLAAGLMDYCGLTNRDVRDFFAAKLGHIIKADFVSSWRIEKSFPFQAERTLKLNTQLALYFPEMLRVTTGMSLSDLRGWVLQHNLPKHRVQEFDTFVVSLTKHRTQLEDEKR